ncbi:uncharacterized protein PAC_00972 [Phialocephala subalpina]|uniref:BTB domain-containing protein n=1 Tax=Phialocephala subalpina TaxID=576137 RepID=A0A1L7WE90_9HELO|nr:uncharacterized protein PAC_00972 [Phialocephala subalpina]
MAETLATTAIVDAPEAMSCATPTNNTNTDAPTAISQALGNQTANDPLVAQPVDMKTALELNLGTEMIALYVGPKRKEFIVYKTPLCRSAKFFDAALNGPFIEGQERIMHLPEDDPGAFRSEKFCITELADKTMDAIQDMAHEYNLLKTLVKKDLLVQLNGEGPKKDVAPDSGEAAEEAIKPKKEKIILENKDIRLIWDLCKEQDEFDFFADFQHRYEENLQIPNLKILHDPRARKEDDKQDRCAFHCRVINFDCRPAEFNPAKPGWVPFRGGKAAVNEIGGEDN